MEENKTFKKLKDKKGFTLVELIVVLVILAILAALLVPALTGYIDKANKEKVVAETRMVVMAAQTEASEAYGKLTSTSSTSSTTEAEIVTRMNNNKTELENLAEVEGKFEVYVNGSAEITKVVYSHSGFTCTYNADAVTDGAGKTTEDAGYTVVKGESITDNLVKGASGK